MEEDTGGSDKPLETRCQQQPWAFDACPTQDGDAACYESYNRYPTDVKLLWECSEWVFEKLHFRLCKFAGTKRTRYKYREQRIKKMVYLRKRSKSFKSKLKWRKSLVHLLKKAKASFRTPPVLCNA